MNITQEAEELEKTYDERYHKIKPSFIIGKDIIFIGEPIPGRNDKGEDCFQYKFKAISQKAIKYFTKKYKGETKRNS